MPPRADSAAPEKMAEVAIVGLGPTGAVLANLLGAAGVSVLVIEQSSDVFPLPRAAHYDGEIMRVFQTLGLMDEVQALSRPGNKGMHFENAQGQTLLVRAGSDQPGPHGHANNWYFHQPDLERVLRAGMRRFAGIETRLGCQVTDIVPGADHVRLAWHDLAGQVTGSAIARYVVGCDGARSLVRRLIGSTQEDLGLHQPWLCLDMLMKRDAGLPPYTIQLCDPARPMTLVNMAGRRRRWEIMLMPGDDPATVANPDFVWPLLSRWITPDDADIERAAVYTFHSVIAHGWRKGRLLIAGDAAHQTPPFLGQGMCAGIRDAANLAWKLAAVLRGQAGEALLDTYESEREPHVRAFIELAVRVGGILQATDPEVAAERDRRFAESGPEVFSFPIPQLGPGLHAGGERPVGSIVAQPRLPDGRLLDEAAGNGFALLATPAAQAWLDDTQRRQLHDLRVVTVVVPSLDGLAAPRQAAAMLIRPDRYVMGLADDATGMAALLAPLPGWAA